jgi:hypothetical protein
MPIDGLLELYRGHVVPKEYNAGYVALSYVISFVGAASTLELINRRSWFNGISNQYARQLPKPRYRSFQSGLLIYLSVWCSCPLRLLWVVYLFGVW